MFLSIGTRIGVPRPRRVCRADRASASDVYVSELRVVGGGQGSPASGRGDCEKCERWLRTRAETGQTWQPSYSRWDSGLRSDVVELKGGRNCDEGQYLQRSVGEGASRYIYSHQMGGVSGVNQHWSQPSMISFKNGSDLQNSESSNAIHNRRLFCPVSCYPTALSFPGVMGRLLIRFPVAAKMALATDGATGGTPVSPNPPGGWSVTTM